MTDTTDDAPALTLAGRPRRKAARARPVQPVTAAMLAGAPHFAPVPRRAVRYDGWTYPRQRAFVKALAETGSVARACRAVGMTNVGAYLLRKAAGADGFAAAWDEALAVGVERLHDIALERAIYGVPKPIFYKGEQVGEERRYNDRLLNAVLRHHDPTGWGANQQRSRVPPHVRAALRGCVEKGLSGRGSADSRGLLRPAWSPACGPRPPVGIIADERLAMRAI